MQPTSIPSELAGGDPLHLALEAFRSDVPRLDMPPILADFRRGGAWSVSGQPYLRLTLGAASSLLQAIGILAVKNCLASAYPLPAIRPPCKMHVSILIALTLFLLFFQAGESYRARFLFLCV